MSTELVQESARDPMQATLDGQNTTQSAMKSTGRRKDSRSRKVVISQGETLNSQSRMSQRKAGAGNALADTATAPLEATAKSTKTKNLLTKRASKPAYLQSLNESEKQANFKIIDSMNKKISYLKNPRHKVSKAPILMTTAIKESGEISEIVKQTSFRVEPTIVSFVDYQVNGVYEIDVKVTNVAKESKRIKFIPPASEMFTVRRTKYPSASTGDVAPGMSLTFSVTFHAPSFADFDDFVTFITEENSFKLPLKARRDPPVINLVNPMSCLNSWLGDRVDMAFRCVNNGGDGGFKFFCDRDEDDLKQTDLDTIKIGSFNLTPSEFYLYSGTAIDIYVSFQPEREGQLEEKLILACDNQTSEYYKVNGFGAMLDLDIIAVDGKEVDFKANPFETMYFENTNPTSTSRRTIRIKNSSPIQVPYHWSIFKQKNAQKISLADEETHYRIEPSQGKIPGGESQEFEVFFCPLHAEPYFEYADLIVEDIPISAVRHPPEGLKNFAAANTQKSKVPMPTYVGSNTQFLSIPMIMFNLRGQGNSCQVQVEPPIAFFEGDLYINQTYTQKVSLRKLTQGEVHYKLRMESKNRSSFDVKVKAQGKILGASNELVEGTIKDDEIDLVISIESQECGDALAYFYIEIEDGSPVSFSCQATFRGPILHLVEPVVDLGLTKVNTKREFSLTLQNKSPIPASFIVKSAKNKKMNFINAILTEEQHNSLVAESRTSVASLVVGQPVKTKKGNQVKFDTYHAVLGPNKSMSIKLTAECMTQETIEEYFEILVKDSESAYFQILGEVQVPKLYLNRETIELGKIYAGIKEVIDAEHGKHKNQSLELVNYGNLPVTFKWDEVNDPAHAIARFEPRRGTIPPKSKVKISFELTMFIGGQIDELFMCDVEDLELPLGFEVKADAFGLNVAYLTSEEQMITSTMSNYEEMRNQMNDTTVYGAMNRLQMVSFTNCQINKPTTSKFILKNLSGIKTKFKLNATNFEPISHVAPQQKTEIQLALEAEMKRKQEKESMEATSDNTRRHSDKRQIKFAASVKSGAFNSTVSDRQRTQPILSDEHEQTQKFSSVTGNTFTQTKALEKEQQFFLSNNKGIALVFSPHEGNLPANAEVPITVTIYNNVCGKFDDKISCFVDGLPTVDFPVRVSISGSPVIVPANQVGLNYNTIPSTLPMPTVVANTSAINKSFKIKNTGIRSLQVDWKIFDQKDLNRVDNDAFQLKIVKNQSYDKSTFPFKFNFKAVEPEESQGSAFEISPKNFTIGSRQTEEFHVTFNPTKDVGNFKSILLASPELSQEEVEIATDPNDLPKKGSLGVISLCLNANTISPLLSLDKSVKLNGGKHIRLKHWSIVDEEDAPSLVQKLTFSNDTKADMTFNFNVNGPFQLIKTKSNTGAKHPLAAGEGTKSKSIKQKAETMFCLQPLKIVELQVKFIVPKPRELDEWPMTMKNERHGELVASFSNGDNQVFTLDGVLLRPKLVLLTEKPAKNDYACDEMNFGIVNVDRHRTIKVFLSNITEVTAKWQLNYVKFPKKATISKYTTTMWEEENLEKVDDPDVFEFSLDSGSLKGKSLPLRKIPEGLHVPPVGLNDKQKQYLPQTIQVNFRPKKNCLYKSKFRFTVENGISCDVILKGKGSYEENHD